MARKRNGLVPAGETSGSLDGTVKAIRDTSPPAQRGFTQANQVNQLVWASEVDADIGFMARLLALCSLPRSNPGNRLQYRRVNGPYTLIMTATGKHKLPFGNFPRLLLAWVSTEAVRTGRRELVLGRSLSAFMRALGVYSSSGGTQTRLRNQMKRLFTAHVQLVYEDQHGEANVSSSVADRSEFWWNPKRPNEPSLWQSKIYLGEAFFNEIIRHPVPLDMHALRALKRSPLGLDLYLWAVYRTFSLAAPMALSWPMLYRQFGVEPSRADDNVTVQRFRRDCLRELKKIKTAWPGLEYRIERGQRHKKPGTLVLFPSAPVVPPLTPVGPSQLTS